MVQIVPATMMNSCSAEITINCRSSRFSWKLMCRAQPGILHATKAHARICPR
jgi:hypothetical protein